MFVCVCVYLNYLSIYLFYKVVTCIGFIFFAKTDVVLIIPHVWKETTTGGVWGRDLAAVVVTRLGGMSTPFVTS